MTELIFWGSFALIGYGFIGYPVALLIIGMFRRRVKQHDETYQPTVSIVLSVYNEEDVIREKIENFLSIEYPQDRLEMVIVSDSSSDSTDDIVRSMANERIRFFVQEQRGGKTLALNRAVPEAKGEIIIFTDANSMFRPDAVAHLARHFKDNSIGLVSGRSLYITSEDENENLGGAYRQYEEWIKEQESSAGSIVGADGAIYAMRKSLYAPLESQQINDLIHTGHVVLNGCNAISDPSAVCREKVDETHEGELRRQTRIMAQSWLIYLRQIRELLAARKFFYAWGFTSHKFVRWLTLPLMALMFGATLALYSEGVFYKFMTYAQIWLILLAICGSRMKSGLLKFPYMFFMLHIAAVLGFYRYLAGQHYAVWNPRNN